MGLSNRIGMSIIDVIVEELKDPIFSNELRQYYFDEYWRNEQFKKEKQNKNNLNNNNYEK